MPTLDFKGKSFVYTHHLSVPFRELVVDAKKSLPAAGAKPSLADNLIIHGDNLHALKALLPLYAGKVDCIYIDPPYNTGNEGWCYNDNVRSPLMKEWLKKAANPVEKDDLERHEKWLCMMWPRLHLLRELLAEDGMIFVSIDDNEEHRLRAVLDEIFGDESFLANISWVKRYTRSNNARMFYSQKDSTLCYRKTAMLNVIKEPRTEKSDAGYANPDKDSRGLWITSSYVNPATKQQRKNLVYKITRPKDGKTIEHPTHAWKYSPEEHARHVQEKLLWWGADGLAEYPRLKLFLDEAELLVPVDVWSYREVGSSDDGSETLKQIFGSAVFDNPKPTGLLEKIIGLTNKKDALVLDSFAGSATTAHAVLALNKKDGGNRKFILVETEDYADKLTAERVRRVARGYQFAGTQREELMREPITLTALKKAGALLEKADSFELLDSQRFDRIAKSVEDGALVVTGEKKVTEKVEGLGGSFTFCTLGEEMGMDRLLAGDKLPSFDSLAKYVFYTATGRTLEEVGTPRCGVPAPSRRGTDQSAGRGLGQRSALSLPDDGFIGETELYRVHLFYKPEKKWLASNEAALTEQHIARMQAANREKKRLLVFAAAKFMSQKELTRLGVEFCQLPYAIHRILGD